jgi:hypothetical protein
MRPAAGTAEIRDREARKSEIRSTKSETNPNSKIPMTETPAPDQDPFRISDLEHSSLFRISSFVLRISAVPAAGRRKLALGK